MWLFTKYGFYSVTVNDAKKDLLQVRARAREDLENILKFAGPDGRGILEGEELPYIIETPQADYRWRVIIPRLAWKEIMSLLVDDLDYSNFKNQIGDHFRHSLYSSVWGIMLRLQERGRADDNQIGLWDRSAAPDLDADITDLEEYDGEITRENELMSLIATEDRIENDPADPFYDPARL